MDVDNTNRFPMHVARGGMPLLMARKNSEDIFTQYYSSANTFTQEINIENVR